MEYNFFLTIQGIKVAEDKTTHLKKKKKKLRIKACHVIEYLDDFSFTLKKKKKMRYLFTRSKIKINAKNRLSMKPRRWDR